MADLTTQVLIEIRDELRKTNSRVDQTNSRLDETNSRLERLEKRHIATEVRLATEIVGLVGAVHELRDVIVADRQYAARLDEHERRISELERR